MATFNFTPSYTAVLTSGGRINKVEYGDGYEQRLAYGLHSSRKSWALTFDQRTNTERDNIRTFLETTVRNGLLNFDWTDPAGTAGKYVCDEFNIEMVSPNRNTITMTFREVFEP